MKCFYNFYPLHSPVGCVSVIARPSEKKRPKVSNRTKVRGFDGINNPPFRLLPLFFPSSKKRSQRTSTSGASGGVGLERRPSLDTISTYLSLDSNSVSVRRSGRAAERLRLGSSSSHYSQSIASPSCMSSAPSDDVFLDPMEEAMCKNLLRGPQPFDSQCGKV